MRRVLRPARKRVIIMGAAGRDFHNFNIFYRDNPEYEVVAFTATQIPYITGRRYPKDLAGKLYPKGIPIHPEEKLEQLIEKFRVDEVVFAYSDVSHKYVMHEASRVNAAGANFVLLGPKDTMLKSKKPVISVCAVRTGAGKSPTTRKICRTLKEMGIKPVVIRHPMPYGDLKEQACQRFARIEDLKKHKATIEEKEDYEGHIKNGFVVYAGVDYEKILREAEKEADVIVFDGGNNDTSFFKPGLLFVIADARRPNHEVSYHPGETNLRMADVVVINKVRTAKQRDIETVEKNIEKLNKKAVVLKADLKLMVDKPALIKGKSILAIDDGPTITHGGLSYGAAYLVAKEYKAKIIDPRPYAVGAIKMTYKKYPHIGPVLPALGYSKEQIEDLEQTINRVPCDTVVIGTPTDLTRYIKISKPVVKVGYEFEEVGKPKLKGILERFFSSSG